ncbi:MAG: hypothetical protein CML22_07325 [Rheinheimera sp.]|nr:hypothetical protein [Rheinheimera sp.]MBM34095.1 hypothetical protein [Rheinheimera sp.]|tara:strand:- start:388 stop:600 length:213 start_codon:yes stop_codon:yes gene_type:complete
MVWVKDAGRRLWRSDTGQIITDESITCAGVKIKFFPVYANQSERNAGNNYASGKSFANAKSLVIAAAITA